MSTEIHLMILKQQIKYLYVNPRTNSNDRGRRILNGCLSNRI